MEDEVFLVGAFSYINNGASEKALKEQSKIMKLENQMDYNNPKVVYSVYCKVIERGVLETLEGVSYLIHLQNFLYENENVLPGPIPSIPAEMLTNSGIFIGEQIAKPLESTEKKEDDNSEATETSSDDKATETSSDDKADEREAARKKEEIDRIVNRKVAQIIKQNKRTDLLRYKIIIAFLVILIGVMLFIAFRSDSPNIINYRNQIQNEYSDWEEQLREKEHDLNQREKELKNL